VKDSIEKLNTKPKANITRSTRINRPHNTLEQEIMEDAGVSIPEDDTIDSEVSQDVYEAYGVSRSPMSGMMKDVEPLITQERLGIKQRNESGYVMPYSLVVLMGYTGDHTITLYCTSYAVIIEGTNLAELRRLLLERKVKWVQEFDGKRYDMSIKELPEGTPVITEIRVKFGRE